jgi:TolB-like protein/tetratricopeptide (TPR) repeat protein
MTGDTEPKGSGGEPTTIFFSYSRDDQKRARPIIALIERAGYSVWWDGLLEGGERFSRTTEAALEGSRAVVVLWSKTSVGSHWVHDEATRGRDLQHLVPLTIDGAEPPLGFRQFQTIDLTKSKLKPGDPAVESMMRAIAALHGTDAPPVAAKPATLSREVNRRLVIAGGAALVAAGAGTAWWAGLFGSGPTINSVAVLPFANMSGDPKQAYFSDGLAAEVRSELSRNPLLQVVAQASSNKFRERSDDAKTISRKLGVSFLLDGNVRRSGDTVRVSAELIDGHSGFSQWSQTFDRPMADVFAVQDEIADAVTAALTAQVMKQSSGSSGGGSKGDGTSNVAAYDAYLRGKDLFSQETDEASDRAALAKFDEAIAADPRYGLAHAARARSLTVIGNQYEQGTARRGVYDSAIEAAKSAVNLSPGIADAHSALGVALLYGRLDVRAARGPYDRSYALGKGDADVLSRYALYCARTGRFDEARLAITRAAGLDPLNARTFRLVGEVEYSARRYAQAIPPIERALLLNPKMAVARAAIGASKLMIGKIDEAKQAYASEPSSLFGLTGMAIIAQRQGQKADAQAALTRLIAEHGDNSLYQQAQIFAQWGEPDRAMAALANARTERDSGLIYMRNDPMLDPLRATPGFSRLLKALGFD